MENEFNEHEFDDVVAAIEDERASKLPQYAGLIDSICGEMERVSEMKQKALEEKEIEL